jgi:hypothetical protein
VTIGRVLIDAGPLVATLRQKDAHREACLEVRRRIRGDAYTCWPVVTEAAWLLRHTPGGVDRLLQMCDGVDLAILPLWSEDIVGVRALLRRYADHPLDLADACLMHLADREGIATVFTIDRRHFSIHRMADGAALHIVP